MKTKILCGALLLTTTVALFAQAEQVKKKAKDLKRNVEAGQTNQVGGATNGVPRNK